MIKNAERGSIENFTAPKMLLKSKVSTKEIPAAKTFTAGWMQKIEAAKDKRETTGTLNLGVKIMAIKPLSKNKIIPVKKVVIAKFHSNKIELNLYLIFYLIICV